MTNEERQHRAEALLKQLETECGMKLVAILQAETFNPSVAQIKAVVALQPIPDWTTDKENHDRPGSD